jgi:tetratricopeptide (TPR) repeat protein
MRQWMHFTGAGLLWAVTVLAFANAKLGDAIENAEMPMLGGGQHHLLGDSNVNVFIFIKPGLAHSRTALTQIAKCEKEMAGKSVHWSAVVSDRIAKADIEQEVKETGITMPVLIDTGDALYGKLGVALHPVIGITDKDHKLAAYEPFTKVNYAEVVWARIRHALKEITDQELEQALKPAAATQGGNASVALRYFKLAEKQFQAGNHEKALENLKKSLEKDAAMVAAHVLRGRIFSAQGNRSEARAAFEAALKLDPKDAAALEGLKAL